MEIKGQAGNECQLPGGGGYGDNALVMGYQDSWYLMLLLVLRSALNLNLPCMICLMGHPGIDKVEEGPCPNPFVEPINIVR